MKNSPIDLVKVFLFHCEFEKNLSIKTLNAYSIDLNQFTNHISQNKIQIQKIELIDKHIIREYLKSLSSFKAKTIKRKIATLKAFFNFLEYEDTILTNPFRKMKISIKEPLNLPKTMNLEEVKTILEGLYEKESKFSDDSFEYKALIRDITVIEILFATGIRVSELCNLKLSDFDLNNGNIIVKGKGSKERLIQVCNEQSLHISKKYFNLFKTLIDDCGYFFVNRLKNPLSEQSVRFMVKKHAKEFGIGKSITPHTFRHTFATLLLEENVNIKYIQHMLGHSSIITTQIYTHVNRKKQEQILTQFHPRNSIKIGGLNAG